MRAHECLIGDITAVSWISHNEQQIRCDRFILLGGLV